MLLTAHVPPALLLVIVWEIMLLDVQNIGVGDVQFS